MKTTVRLHSIFLAGITALCAAAARADEPAPGLLGWWRFDEGSGVYSACAVDPAGEAELHNVRWVRGDFGTALRLTGSDSYATLPALPKLDGSGEMTLAVWVYWEGTGQYPNEPGHRRADVDPGRPRRRPALERARRGAAYDPGLVRAAAPGPVLR